MVEELWFKFVIIKPQGYRLVSRVSSARGSESSGKATTTLALVALAALFAGQVWVFQFINLFTGYLAGIPRLLDNAWHSILWLSDNARYIERFPGLFGFFALGLVFLVGGVYGLKDLWSSIFLLKRKPS